MFAFQRGMSTYYVASDRLGTPRVVADASGAVVKAMEYDSYGFLHSVSNPSFDLPIGFAGGIPDTTGWIRFGFRDYEPGSGRWVSRDPILYKSEQANLYQYVQNNPLNFTDPLGLWRTHPRYGNWGGEGWSGGDSGKEAPIDSLDICFKGHDLCYDHLNNGDTCNPKKDCDKELAACLYSLPANSSDWAHRPPNPIYAGFYRTWALTYFQTQY